MENPSREFLRWFPTVPRVSRGGLPDTKRQLDPTHVRSTLNIPTVKMAYWLGRINTDRWISSLITRKETVLELSWGGPHRIYLVFASDVILKSNLLSSQHMRTEHMRKRILVPRVFWSFWKRGHDSSVIKYKECLLKALFVSVLLSSWNCKYNPAWEI